MSSAAAWACIFAAGLLEVAWAVGLKYTAGFTRLVPSALTLAGMAASFLLLSQALRVVPIGTAYAVWTGIGAAGTAIVGILFLGESAAVVRLVSIVLIVAGIVGLKFFSCAPS